MSQTRRRHIKNVVGTDPVLKDVRSNGNKREIASDLSRKEESGGRTVLPLQTNSQANRRGVAVVRSGDDWWEQLQGHNRHRGNGTLR